MSDFERIIRKAVNDAGFKNKLSMDPAGALREAGVEATPEKVDAVLQSAGAFQRVHRKFGEIPRAE